MPIARIRCKKTGTIRGVSIANEISRGVVPRERLGDLARDPLRGRICRHAVRSGLKSKLDRVVSIDNPSSVIRI
jgi:hypothetical protein